MDCGDSKVQKVIAPSAQIGVYAETPFYILFDQKPKQDLKLMPSAFMRLISLS